MVKPYSLSSVIISLLLFGCYKGSPLNVNQLCGEWRYSDQGFVMTLTLLPDAKFTIARERFQSATLSMSANKSSGTWGLSGPHEIWTSEGGNPPLFWHDVS